MRDFLDRVSDEVSGSVDRLRDTVFGDEDDDLPEVLQDDGSRDRDFESDAAIVSTAVIDQFAPDSVFDIGCGIGLHLKPFLDDGITAAGVDEAKVAHENAVVSTRRITIHDLDEPYDPGKTYEVILCLDMLEYTSREQEDALITTVANAAADTAVVSVPLPRYSTLRYAREEPEDYWIDRFAEHGLIHDTEATEALQDRIDATEEAWVPEQLMVFQVEEDRSS